MAEMHEEFDDEEHGSRFEEIESRLDELSRSNETIARSARLRRLLRRRRACDGAFLGREPRPGMGSDSRIPLVDICRLFRCDEVGGREGVLSSARVPDFASRGPR